MAFFQWWSGLSTDFASGVGFLILFAMVGTVIIFVRACSAVERIFRRK